MSSVSSKSYTPESLLTFLAFTSAKVLITLELPGVERADDGGVLPYRSRAGMGVCCPLLVGLGTGGLTLAGMGV